MKAKMKKQMKWLAPPLLLALVAPFTPHLDLAVASYFYDGKAFSEHPYFTFLFKFGEMFGFFFGAVTLLFYLLSWISKKHRHFRQGSLLIGLTLFMGAGVITNAILKEYWGRPRPKQLVEFGGTLNYRAFWQPNFEANREPQKSFPSGHVAMGFFYLSLIVVGHRYNNKMLYYMGVALTLFWGVGLMVARVAQGGHFVSDVLISPIIMWLTVLVIARFTLVEQKETNPSLELNDRSAESDSSEKVSK